MIRQPTAPLALSSQLCTRCSLLRRVNYKLRQSQYNTVKSSAQQFSAKTLWQTELNKIKSVSVPNTYGETNGLTNALNLNSQSAAAMAWTNTKLGLTPESSTTLTNQTVGQSSNLSQLAMIEASDAASPDCLNAVGSYRQSRNDSVTAEASLQEAQLDGSASTNSEVEQLNLLNMSQAQQLNEQQAQGALHTCLAQQMTIQNMQQRNAAAAGPEYVGLRSSPAHHQPEPQRERYRHVDDVPPVRVRRSEDNTTKVAPLTAALPLQTFDWPQTQITSRIETK